MSAVEECPETPANDDAEEEPLNKFFCLDTIGLPDSDVPGDPVALEPQLPTDDAVSDATNSRSYIYWSVTHG